VLITLQILKYIIQNYRTLNNQIKELIPFNNYDYLYKIKIMIYCFVINNILFILLYYINLLIIFQI
jgi:hypothetical protein